MTHESFDDEMTEFFQSLGMTSEAARVAAAGREPQWRRREEAAAASEAFRAMLDDPVMASLQDRLHPTTAHLPLVTRAEVELNVAARRSLGMGAREAAQYAARHRERAEARTSDEVDIAAQLVELGAALYDVPTGHDHIRPGVAPARRSESSSASDRGLSESTRMVVDAINMIRQLNEQAAGWAGSGTPVRERAR